MGRQAWRVERGTGGQPFSELAGPAPGFAYAKVPVVEIGTVWQLTDAGFRVVDTALAFEGAIGGETDRGGVRFARDDDREPVAGIAAGAFRYSRFHLDPLIPGELADAIKAAWAVNYFEGKRGDGMVVAEHANRVVGFLQLLWSAPDHLVIDLVGVAPASQGRGIGRDMILYAARHGTGDGRLPSRISVGTQAANVPSVRLYESLGLRLREAQYVLHHHGNGETVHR
jgi:ribosomal protein S18 acetylase RimI-like enzyme